MDWGMDYLGLARYSEVVLANHPAGWAVGAFSNTFGDPLPAIDALIDRGLTNKVRLHLMWKDNHKYSEADFVGIIKEAKRVLPLIKKYEGRARFQLSGGCEHNLPANLAKKLGVEVMRAAENRVDYVNTPLTKFGGGIVAGVINEVHGSMVGAPARVDCQFSSDGQGIEDCDVEKLKSRFRLAKTFYLWTPSFNLKRGEKDSTPRDQRKVKPSDKIIKSLEFLATGKGKDSIPRGWLWKSHSEAGNPPGARDYKPVLISKIKAREVILTLRNGKRLAVMPYYGEYSGNGGGYRYYCGEWGYEIAEKAKRQQGDSLINIVIEGKSVGTINPAFRAGYFR